MQFTENSEQLTEEESNMDFEKTVEMFCDGFCKYPYTCADEDELREKCENCPICELVERLEGI